MASSAVRSVTEKALWTHTEPSVVAGGRWAAPLAMGLAVAGNASSAAFRAEATIFEATIFEVFPSPSGASSRIPGDAVPSGSPLRVSARYSDLGDERSRKEMRSYKSGEAQKRNGVR